MGTQILVLLLDCGGDGRPLSGVLFAASPCTLIACLLRPWYTSSSFGAGYSSMDCGNVELEVVALGVGLATVLASMGPDTQMDAVDVLLEVVLVHEGVPTYLASKSPQLGSGFHSVLLAHSVPVK